MIRFGASSKGYGKRGSSVFVINHGVQIEREYNGRVSNPSTAEQVGQRSRFKLASQISACLGDVLVYPRRGLSSPRNQFVKRNMGYFYADINGAIVSYEALGITVGSTAIPPIVVDRTGTTKMTVALQYSAIANFDTVVYNIFRVIDTNNMLLISSVVVDGDEDNDAFLIDVPKVEGDIVVYAYGIKSRNARARAKYYNYNIQSGADVARLVSSRALEASNYLFSASRGVFLADGQSETPDVSDNSVVLRVETLSPVSVQVTGAHVQAFDNYWITQRGDTVTLTATQVQGYSNWRFLGWYKDGEQQPFSLANPLQLQLVSDANLLASAYGTPGLE